MKAIWKQCWKEFTEWFCAQWEYAWSLLKISIIDLVSACFEWAKAILGSAVAGLWKLVLKPVGKWCYETIIEWIKKI